MRIRPAEADDTVDIAYIYNYYIATSHATFEVEPVDAAEVGRRLASAEGKNYPFLVADDDEIVGYAYAHEFRSRCAYEQTVEISIYLRPGHDGKRVGSRLYEALFDDLRAAGRYHAVIAGIALPNDPSVALHEKFGMTKVAHFRDVGYKFGRWIDVGYWELVLSDAAGSSN